MSSIPCTDQSLKVEAIGEQDLNYPIDVFGGALCFCLFLCYCSQLGEDSFWAFGIPVVEFPLPSDFASCLDGAALSRRRFRASRASELCAIVRIGSVGR